MTGNDKRIDPLIAAMERVDATEKAEADEAAARLGLRPVPDPDAGAPTGPMARPVIKSQDILARERQMKNELIARATGDFLETLQMTDGSSRMDPETVVVFNGMQAVIERRFDARVSRIEATGKQP